MSLIELLYMYRDLIRDGDKSKANEFLNETCDVSLHEHIQNSVNSSGEFIKADRSKFTF